MFIETILKFGNAEGPAAFHCCSKALCYIPWMQSRLTCGQGGAGREAMDSVNLDEEGPSPLQHPNTLDILLQYWKR